ncbi:cytokine-dependent hematopoietic cell linker [Sminthopsis crassicaudata]|uniref:cytokine-dependent hematopoietic cell linker n=1 Tax=Sminthopsis crassicaudata TaxID=9301 RepID=UPI003D682A2F
MNRQGNGRTTKEGSSALKSWNLGLSPNRSWFHILATGQHRTLSEDCSSYDRNIANGTDGAQGTEGEYYEETTDFPEKGLPSVKILPARPIEESQYADTHCFQEVLSSPLPASTQPGASAWQQPPWNLWTRSEEGMQILADIRDLNLKGEREARGIQNPLPPPRPPNTLPKKYRPLPPEPEKSRVMLNQRNDFLKDDRIPRQISLKDLNDVYRREKVPEHPKKPVLPCQNQHNPKDLSAPVASSLCMVADPSFQGKGQRGSLYPASLQRSPQPASGSLPEDKPLPSSLHQKKPGPSQSSKKLQAFKMHDWYLGECSRHEVEAALTKENADGTFLVRDGSKKSVAEPYVLVVFHRKKVYNIKIRYLEGSQQFALGTGLRGNDKFDSVEDIIEFHKHFPIVLIDGKDQTGTHREHCYLKQSLSPSRIYSS